MKEKAKRIILVSLICINCIIIFCFSHQIAEESSRRSNKVVEFVSNTIPTIKNMQEPDKTIFKKEMLAPFIRKTAHFSIYTLLGILTISYTLLNKDGTLKKRALTAFLFCVCYAISDEIHQLFIPGRSGEIRDVIIDSLGAVTGIVMLTLSTILYQKKKNKEK